MTIRSHRDLIVWQKGMKLANCVYRLTYLFPKSQTYSLCSQMQRAAVSIPANIAEGNGRSTRRDYAHFLSMALGSARELDTLLILARDLEMASATQFRESMELNDEVCRILFRMRQNFGIGKGSEGQIWQPN
ncbi:four helix bundle protein [bacterium]|nr:four helix bundle protein [bacterium]